LTASADPPAAASEAYGRDDPAYGPPGPGWYDKEQAASYGEQAVGEPAAQVAQAARAETAPPAAAQAETGQPAPAQAAATGPVELNPHVVRGPFEPLVESAGQTSARDAAGAHHGAESTRSEGTRARPWEDGGDVGGSAAWGSDDDPDGAPTGLSEYEPASYEFPGLADDDPAGSADAALDRLKALHQTAAAVAPQSLDAHFDQLLERQRRLISEYLGQTGSPGAPAATSTTTAAADYADGSLVGFGDDHRSTR
jgi:hypothetical protein